MTRSVFAKILLWCFGTLVLSLLAFFAISSFVSRRLAGDEGPFRSMNAMQLYDAQQAYETGGPEKLGGYLQELRRFFKGEFHFTDGNGKDLVTGEDRATLLREAGAAMAAHEKLDGRFAMVTISPNRKVRMIALVRPPVDFRSLIPFYLLLLAAVAALSWALAVNIASPLQALAKTVERFGRGELDVRFPSSRKDEIGELARSFNEMAVRIQTLLTAERRLLQDISHELRSPLARLSFAAELARTAKDRDAAASRLKREIQRLTDLVSALIQVTRAEGDPDTHKTDELSLDTLLHDVTEDCSVEAEARGCHLELTGDAEVTMLGDRELMRRAIENVLRNAIRYAPESTKVVVRLGVANNRAVISVRDFGPGVPEEELPKIFTPFFRVDTSRDGSTGGLGLGLAIAYRAITLHHGELAARNADPGLIVTMSLPAVARQNVVGVTPVSHSGL